MASPKDLQDQIEATQFIWAILKSLSREHPAASSGLMFVFLLVVVGQFRTSSRALMEDFQRNRRVTLVVLPALLLFAVGTVTILGQKNLPLTQVRGPIADQDLLGESVTVSWHVHDVVASQNSRYVVEVQSQSNSQRHFTFADYYAFRPAEEGRFRWRACMQLKESGKDWKQASEWSAWQHNAYYQNTLARIRLTGVLRVAVSLDYLEPFIFHNDETGSLDGIDIKVVEVVRAGLEAQIGRAITLQYVPGKWLEGNSRDLTSGLADLAIGETSILRRREEEYRIRFTDAYWYESMALVTRSSAPVQAISDMRLTAWKGTIYETVARSLGRSYSSSVTVPDMFDSLSRSEVDGLIDGTTLANSNSRARGGNFTIRVLTESELPQNLLSDGSYPTPAGLYVGDNEVALLESINTILRAVPATRRLEALRAEYSVQ